MFIDKKLVTTNKSGFTLVELIVVISILAILGTIAFLSFGWYSSSARDAKRSQNLDDIVKAMTIGQANGVSISSYVTAGAAALTTGWIAWSGSLAGYTGWDVNTTALGLKSTDYQDPSSAANYKIGATTFVGWAFEVAATMEAVNGTKTTRVLGNYRPRGITWAGLVAVTGTWANNTIKIWAGDIGKFKVSDYVTANTVATTITNISADGQTITLAATPGAALGNIVLQNVEVGWLVKETWAGTAPVTDGSVTLFPY
ncbi:MAG: hypothetical protein ACD_49C00041G0001 [uncultured bacterium (gcode 4)]|uniref:Uncharacterized protein n=1 Tax=uncultured bacterium (gcode 4) TaxID=1234023 RepID=K2BW09_9BACT|nr:MAG: hypothetical protein ACD_49C00041G0001 [uncultured bacterium (gcode 4)]